MIVGTDGTEDSTVASAAEAIEGLLSDTEDPQTETATPDETPAEDNADDTVSTEEETDDSAASDENDDATDETESDDENPDESDEPETPAAPQTFKVKVDGEEADVPLDELIKGYSRTADYTRKTQALAEERRKLETEVVPALRQKETEYGQYLGQLRTILENAQEKEPDWAALKAADPIEFSTRYIEWQQQQDQLRAISEEQQALAAQQRAYEQVQHRQRIDAEKQKLVQVLPEWSKPEVAKREKAELQAYAAELGYTSDDMKQVFDHRLILLLRNAMLYSRAQKATPKPAAPSKPSTPRAPTVKPGAAATHKTASSKQREAARSRLRASGHVDDATALIADLL